MGAEWIKNNIFLLLSNGFIQGKVFSVGDNNYLAAVAGDAGYNILRLINIYYNEQMCQIIVLAI